MELANSVFQDETGSIKVKIENDKCISCGRCISACKHEVRYFTDQTERFFNSLKNGIPISVVVAPSIRTNFPKYKRLFTYLKQLGVNKIYDVSLGADICIWGHVKQIQKYPGNRVITQPCPVIVSYVEMYRYELLKWLSPIHSPIGCTSIYLKEYQGIDDMIAAFTPCIAKSNEFRDTGLAQYNITFTKLIEYIKENNIKLPYTETDFDNEECGLGALFPIQGGLKENIDYFTDGKLYVLKSEGFTVYDKLDKYLETDGKLLPDIFDVLNCEEGCNIGPASSRDRSVFDIDNTMNNIRKDALEESKRKHYEEVYKTYDNTLNLDHFKREYAPIVVEVPQIAESDIEAAFKVLGKDNYEKKNIDCSACGSQTCYDMARKIALNVNIPINCIVKSMEDARTEHDNYLSTHNQLLEAVEIAQEASKAKTEFLANMSHEIRTPMNAIIGMSEILEHENLNDSQTSYVKDIKISAHALLGIINDILDMSKIEAGRLELNPVDYNFKQLMDNTVSMFTHITGNEGLEFIYTTDGEIPDYLYGDDIRLRQVITNICGNAVKFTKKGYIRLSVTSKNEKLVIKIEDTGIGIREEDLPKLFQAFEQLDKVKNRSVVGTGLGLTICKSLVEMMGGDILAESEYGKGTSFTVTLPIEPGNEKNIKIYELGKVTQHITAPDAKILITDDNDFNLKVTGGLLNLMDIAVDTANSGFKAIDMIQETDYDIVFMDHMMPEMDGVETVRRIRSLGGKFLSINIIALTANAVKGAREMFLDNGFDDFISKPIDINELREIVKKYLPPGKISIDIDIENSKDNIDKEKELRIKLIKTFIKENRHTYETIASALKIDDIQSAHRIAHTLKSSAGYLGKNELHKVALSLEKSLHSDPPGYSESQLKTLETELASALAEFDSLLSESKDEKEHERHISETELSAMLAELEPLLISGDLSSMGYAEKLKGIPEMTELVELIEDYDFTGASEFINKMNS